VTRSRTVEALVPEQRLLNDECNFLAVRGRGFERFGFDRSWEVSEDYAVRNLHPSRDTTSGRDRHSMLRLLQMNGIFG